MSKLISIDDILKHNAPKTSKYIPRFVVNILKKIVHEKEINEFINNHKHHFGNKFVYDVLKYFKTHIEFKNIDKVPKTGKYVFAGNHPLGALDGLAFIHLVNVFFGNAKAIVNELLMYLDNLKPVFEGVNVFGKFSKEQNKKIEELYKSDYQVVIFPSGTVSRKIKGKITDVEWQKSFLTKAIKTQRDIVPVYIEAQNTNFFYSFANIRKFFGIKFNIELTLLPDQMFRFRDKKIKFTFGEPIPYQIFDKSKNMNEWKKFVRKKVYELK